MNVDQAQNAVSISAFVVAGIFAYRKLIEDALPNNHNTPNTAHFVIGFGFTFVLLAIFAQAAPELGGMLAILVATGDLLTNGKPLVADITRALNQTRNATA